MPEKLGDGLTFTFDYDSQNRCIQLDFCDGSISYWILSDVNVAMSKLLDCEGTVIGNFT